ncbi:MAG TPA: phosphoribosylamine--glycine ligase [Alphaproteobacteria bacterium]|nr:phosphoribosylamine--glycine ligase [Alphaproteobacteria bacterium]
MKTLVIGSGGREHALCWAIAKSPMCSKLYCAPGNAGIAAVAECLPIAVDKIADILNACQQHQIEFVVIGPELPLTLGLADKLREAGIACFGPSQAAAEIEGSKGFMKDLAAKAKIPTAIYKRFTDAEAAKQYVQQQGAPIVVKADGLAAGKGVTVARTLDEALGAIDDIMTKKVFGAAGAEVVIEECMEGEEVSFFALCDGNMALPFAAAQDHKAVYDGDKGPNTGGMGAYSPAPIVDNVMQDRIMREIVNPAVNTMRDMGRPFTGVLFAGLMMTKTGPKLIEFNARFGDPETEAMLVRLKSDLLALLYAASKGMLDGINIQWHSVAALCVIMAANGYPGSYQKGSVIRGLEKAGAIENAEVFHAGTERNASGEVTANGGRVLAVTGAAATIAEAQAKAYQAVDSIDWKDGFCRRDIGWRAVGKTKAA